MAASGQILLDVEFAVGDQGIVPLLAVALDERLLKELVELVCVVSIYLDLLETWELSAEVQLAELMNALVSTGSLLAELVAGEIENLETLGVVLFV